MSKHWVNSLIPLYNESGGHVGVWRAIQMVIFISMNLLQILIKGKLMIYVSIIVILNIAVFKLNVRGFKLFELVNIILLMKVTKY